MYFAALPKLTAELLDKIKGESFLQPFYLTGGTALCLQLGHRKSEDLDFFSEKDFEPINLQSQLEKFGKLESVEMTKGTLNLFVRGVKLQFLHYPYKLLEPVTVWDGIRLSSLIDIFCTKLQTISIRGSKKDFIDVYFLLKKFPLQMVLDKLLVKYLGVDYSLPHILKSLVYFVDADRQPTPEMCFELDWGEVKEEMIRQVKTVKL